MRPFLIRRLLAAIPLLLFVTFFTKAMLVMSPGNFLDELRLKPNISPSYLERMEQKYHLDSKNVFERYWYWLKPAVQGDLGDSFITAAPVTTLIGYRLLNTLILTGAGL